MIIVTKFASHTKNTDTPRTKKAIPVVIGTMRFPCSLFTVMSLPVPLFPPAVKILLRSAARCMAGGGSGHEGAIQAHTQGREGWVWVLGGIGLLFNPLIPVYLSKGVWVLIDLITAVLIGVAASIIRRGPINA